MKRWYWVVLSILAVVGGCGRVRTRDCDPRLFLNLYDTRQFPEQHFDYRGVRDGYHYMAYYAADPDNGVYHAKLRSYLRVPVSSMPAGFPDHAQQSIREWSAEELAEDERQDRAIMKAREAEDREKRGASGAK